MVGIFCIGLKTLALRHLKLLRRLKLFRLEISLQL